MVEREKRARDRERKREKKERESERERKREKKERREGSFVKYPFYMAKTVLSRIKCFNFYFETNYKRFSINF